MEFSIFTLLSPKETINYVYDTYTLRQVMEKFSHHKYSVVPIIDKDGNYISSISEGDILRFLNDNIKNIENILENTNIMSIKKYRPYTKVYSDATFDEIYAFCLSQNFVPVVDDREKFVGIIKRKDVFIYLKNQIK